MFSLIWKAIVGGNPLEIVVIMLGLLSALGLAFGSGYAVASKGAIKTVATVATNAQGQGATAQKKHDDRERAREAVADQAKDTREKDLKRRLDDALAALRANDKARKPCIVPKADIDALNKAGETQ